MKAKKFIFTPRLADGTRLTFYINATDRKKVAHRGLDWKAVVTDIDSGQRYAVQGAECELDCACDALARPIRKARGVGV